MMCCTTLLALLLEEQKARELADKSVRHAAPTGDKYMQLLAEGVRHATKQDWHRAASSCRAAIALRPDEPVAYYNLGATLANSGHPVEAAQRYLEAKERYQVGSEMWAQATARVFKSLAQEACAEVAKPDWWNDEGLKALSARVVRAAPDDGSAHQMRAMVLTGQDAAWEAGPRSAAELTEAATHYERAAVLAPAPMAKASLAGNADCCRRLAEAM